MLYVYIYKCYLLCMSTCCMCTCVWCVTWVLCVYVHVHVLCAHELCMCIHVLCVHMLCVMYVYICVYLCLSVKILLFLLPVSIVFTFWGGIRRVSVLMKAHFINFFSSHKQSSLRDDVISSPLFCVCSSLCVCTCVECI